MSAEPVLSIVLPAYKERDNLAVLVPQIEEGFRDVPHEVIVVDDGSKDGTRELLEGFQATYGNVVLIERPGLMGIGSALRDGYDRARGTYIVSSDADCSFSVEDMRRVYDAVRADRDLVLGYKVTAEPHDAALPGKWSLQGWVENKVTSPLSNAVIGLMTGLGLKNYNTNFRAFRRDLWRRLKTVEDRQFFLFEVVIRSKRLGARIGEVPVTFSSRKAGESKVSFLKQAPGYFWKLVRMVYFDRAAH